MSSKQKLNLSSSINLKSSLKKKKQTTSMSAAHTYKTRSWKARVGEPLKVEADVASGRHCLRRGRGEQ